MKLGCFVVLVMSLGLTIGWSDEPEVVPSRRKGRLFQIPQLPPLAPRDAKQTASTVPKVRGWKLSGHVRCEDPESKGAEQHLIILVDIGDPSRFVVLAKGETQGSLSFQSMDEQAGFCVIQSSESNQTFKVFWPTPNIGPEPRPPICFQSAPVLGVVELYGRLQSKAMITPPRMAKGSLQYRSKETSRVPLMAELSNQLNAAGVALIPTGDRFVFAIPVELTHCLLPYTLKPVVPKTLDPGETLPSRFGDIGVNQLAKAYAALTGRTLTSSDQPEVMTIPGDADKPQSWIRPPTFISKAPAPNAKGVEEPRATEASDASVKTAEIAPPFGDRVWLNLSPSERLYWIEARALLGGLTFEVSGAKSFYASRSTRPLESLLTFQKTTLGATNRALLPTLHSLASAYDSRKGEQTNLIKIRQDILNVEEATSDQPGSKLVTAIMDLVKAHDAAGDVEEGDLAISESLNSRRLEAYSDSQLRRDAGERFARQARWKLALESFTQADRGKYRLPPSLATDQTKIALIWLHQGEPDRYRMARTVMLTNALANYPADRPPIQDGLQGRRTLSDLLSVALAFETDAKNLDRVRDLFQRLALDPVEPSSNAVRIPTSSSARVPIPGPARIPVTPIRTSSSFLKGLLAYREGTPSVAEQELQRATDEAEGLGEELSSTRVQIYATRAMALLQLGRTNNAFDWFRKASEWSGMASRSLGKTRAGRWDDVVLSEVLYREAREKFSRVPGNISPFELKTPWTSWTNSLGMVFRPVPNTRVQFSIWETRVDDFDRFVQSSGYRATGVPFSWRTGSWVRANVSWRNPGFAQSPYHPVCELNWEDAQAFCSWLSSQEKRHYRLPTDEEWSRAQGLNEEEKIVQASNTRDPKRGDFPWGADPVPLLSGHPVGNFAGEELLGSEGWSTTNTIGGFRDAFLRTAPVGSFPPNRLGLYDLAGNVNEWLEDESTGDTPAHQLRGGSWLAGSPRTLSSTNRTHARGKTTTSTYGFRVVVEAP